MTAPALILPSISERVVYLNPIEGDPLLEQNAMRFHLDYEGTLRSSQQKHRNCVTDTLVGHKHEIRQCFHKQLKQLWAEDRFLQAAMVPTGTSVKSPTPLQVSHTLGMFGYGPLPDVRYVPLHEALANNFQRNGYRFVPLVTEEIGVLCSIDILILRRDFPGGVVTSGDLDNRVKTLVDALRMPRCLNELKGNETPKDDENPFFCLLSDDSLITGLAVTSDRLLGKGRARTDDERSLVRLVIEVRIAPYNISMLNLGFA
jgi:hypothetical protein